MLIDTALNAIEYFQTYYKPHLYIALTLSMLAQNTPTVVVLYFVLPVVLWGYIGAHWRQYAPLLQGKAAMYSAGFIIAAEALMLFLLVSFFGTGNLATVSSFDPNWVRCFVTTFSPFTMMALIVFKLLVPVLLLICVLKAMVIISSVPKTKMFTLTLMVCDWMCMNFFFLVKNKGSWMEIGSSISHFVILECTTIVVIMMYELARFVTDVTLTTSTSRTRPVQAYVISSQCLPYTNKERVE
uniref:GPI ethanolamine phosphate transferase 1 n=1 Tax=Anopheles melas TaxID=34690 RepID=A0A182TTI6_9DIPT